MKQLSGGNLFISKYVTTAMWSILPIVIAITIYNKFGQIEVFYLVPFFMLVAVVMYMPMKVSYDESKIVISDLFTREEYKFEDIKSLSYAKRGFISYHPYTQLELVMNDETIRKVKFSFRGQDAFLSLFSKEPVGRHNELLELWKKHAKPTTDGDGNNEIGAKVIGKMQADLAPRNLYRNILLAAVIVLIVICIIHQFTIRYSMNSGHDQVPFLITSILGTGQMVVVLLVLNKCRYITTHPTDETKFVFGNFFSNSYEQLNKLQVIKKVWSNFFKIEIDGQPYYIFASDNMVDEFTHRNSHRWRVTPNSDLKSNF